MEKTTIYLPPSLAVAIRSMAKRKGRSQADLIREALVEYVSRDRPLPRSIGIISDPTLSGADVKEWIQEERHREWAERHGHQ